MSISPDASRHDAYAADYDRQVRDYDCYIAEAVFGLCFEATQPGQQLLEVGIGTGLAAALFAKAGLHVRGFDFSRAMLDICATKGIATDLTQHDIEQRPWPYPAGTFDHVVCCGVLHFIAELDGVLGEAQRVLRDGGLFTFTTKAPVAVVDDARHYNQQTSSELAVFAHAPDYVEALIEQAHFERQKVMRCFVGQDIFYVWCARKQATENTAKVTSWVDTAASVRADTHLQRN